MGQKGGNFAVLFHLPNIRGEEVVNTMGDLAYAYGEGNGWEFLAVDISQSGDHDFGFKLKALPALYFYHTYMGVTTKEAYPGEDMAANQVAAEMAKFQYKLLKKRLDETAYSDEDEDGKEDEDSEEGAGGGTEEQARPKTEFFGMTSVLEVDSANFESVMADKAPIILKLYAPWCGHCQSMKPNYIAAADRMKRSKFPVRFAAVDCDSDNNKPLCQQFGIKSFPTIVYREAKAALSEFKAYEGERSEEALYEFAFGLAGELATVRPVAELTGQTALQSECLGFGGYGTSTVCIIAFLPDIYEGGKSARNAHLAALKDLAKAEGQPGPGLPVERPRGPVRTGENLRHRGVRVPQGGGLLAREGRPHRVRRRLRGDGDRPLLREPPPRGQVQALRGSGRRGRPGVGRGGRPGARGGGALARGPHGRRLEETAPGRGVRVAAGAPPGRPRGGHRD